MKKAFNTASILVLFFLAIPLLASAQEDNILKDCKKQIHAPFIKSGQPLQAFLTGDEVAEFRTTLFDGNIYRIVTCSPDQQKIWFSVYDHKRNLLFASNRFQTPSSWDFKMEGTMDCIIEAGLDPESSDSGMALLMVGFTNTKLAD